MIIVFDNLFFFEMEVNILFVFIEIKMNNCFSIFMGIDFKNGGR